MATYREFKLIIRNNEDITVARSSKPSEPFDAKVQLDCLTEETNDALNLMMIEKRLTKREDFVVFGSHLYRTLFNQRTNKEFMEEYAASKAAGEILRLVLEFGPNANKLAEWPWEYLYYPDERSRAEGGRGAGFFIATEGELVLTRHIPLDSIKMQPLESPLRILFVVGTAPKEYSEIIYEDVLNALNKLEESYPGLFKINPLKEPTKDLFTQTVNEWKPHVVHYIGHGKYENKGYLSWNNEQKSGDFWIDENTWAGCFEDYRPHLIFLQACNSAKSESYRGFKGVAQKLIYLKSRIPAVIAMQHPIEQGVGIHFALKFYRLLVHQTPVGVAVQMARKDVAKNYPKALEDYSDRGFGSPVLFLQAEGPIIKQVFDREKVPEKVSPQPEVIVDCPYSLDSNYGCDGKVRLNDRFCTSCRREIMRCPRCNFIMGQEIGFCTKCGFDVKKSLEPKRGQMLAKDAIIEEVSSTERPKPPSGTPNAGGV